MSGQQRTVCPHLGLHQDNATHMGFPSVANFCLNCKNPTQPSLAHQKSHCLGSAHVECPVYLAQGRVSMPADLRGTVSPISGNILKFVPIFFIVLLVIIFFVVRPMLWPKDSQIDVPEPILPLVVQPTMISAPATQDPTPTLSESVAVVPIPSSTPELPRPILAFEVTRVPLGGNQSYLIHVVKEQETLDLIAVNYNTTVQAIIAVNYKITPPVWVDYPIVVPVGAEDETGLPSFTVYEVKDEELISSILLAEKLTVDVESLERYNGCSNDCQFARGDVLLIPQTP